MTQHIIQSGATLVEALDALNRISGAPMTLFVTGSDAALEGSLTDGDIRRALLAGHPLTAKVGAICRRDCLRLQRDRSNFEVIAEARRRRIDLLPVVEEGRIVALLDLNKLRGMVPADAVLMAGGQGERLRPLTLSTPKPLLPVAGTPVIDHNIALLRSFGIERIFVVANYLKDQMKSHLRAAHPGLACIEETHPCGTIGGISLIKDFHSPNVIVMNADLITDINLEALYLRHIETEAWLTVAVVPYTVSVPYAIVESDGTRVTGLHEKPSYNFHANAGIYIMRRELAEELPENIPLDATELIESLLKRDLRVSLFDIKGRWIDIGSPDDYRYACELLKNP